jgi:hypothetical protein
MHEFIHGALIHRGLFLPYSQNCISYRTNEIDDFSLFIPSLLVDILSPRIPVIRYDVLFIFTLAGTSPSIRCQSVRPIRGTGSDRMVGAPKIVLWDIDNV